MRVQLREALEREKRDLRRMQRAMGQLSRVVGDFSLENRGSWPGLAERLLGVLVDGAGLYDDVAAYMASNDRELIAEDIPIALPQFGMDRETNIVFERGDIRAMYHEAQGAPFWVVHYGNSSEWDLYAQEDQDPAPIFAHLCESLWRGRRALRLDLRKGSNTYGPGEVFLSEIDLSGHRYVGALERCIDEWRQFREVGIRRSVLLQGKPGSGKSTLCLHAARELTERAALLSAEVYEAFHGAAWKTLLRILSPQMIILDDIDRVGSNILGAKLDSFEEGKGADELPFIMFTSNDIEKIPGAFRRPGRIDQILLVNEPEEGVKRAMIERFARRVGVEVPAEQLPRLQRLLTTHSGAHVIEALRRARVLGWEHAPGDEDITFRTAEE